MKDLQILNNGRLYDFFDVEKTFSKKEIKSVIRHLSSISDKEVQEMIIEDSLWGFLWTVNETVKEKRNSLNKEILQGLWKNRKTFYIFLQFMKRGYFEHFIYVEFLHFYNRKYRPVRRFVRNLCFN